jgi:hypothetical protein
MLTDIVENYLQFSKSQAQALLDLLTLEQCWHTNTLSTIKTQADFITFIQETSQSQWYKTQDASQLADTHYPIAMNNQYYAVFESLGLAKAVSCSIQPDYSVILGCFEIEVISRIQALKRDLLNNILPKQNIIFSLGCSRELGLSFVEHESIKKLNKLGLATTEINMINLLIAEEILTLNNKFKNLHYQPLVTTNLTDKHVTTADTAVTLKLFIKKHPDYPTLPRPISIATYSNQPYILRQQRDIQVTMGDDYKIIGLGNALTASDFQHDPKSINICLGEIARLIYINYTRDNLKKLAVELTRSELAEIHALSN